MKTINDQLTREYSVESISIIPPRFEFYLTVNLNIVELFRCVI
ncbi:MAG: hypothetical protein R6V50_06820 [Thermoplasmatota archaeon]